MAASTNHVDVAVVGGGPAGLATARAIARAAPRLSVAVLERAPKLVPVGFTIGLMGNGLHTLHALDPALGASVEARLLPDGPVVQYDPATLEKTLERPSAKGIFEQWCKNLGHFPWHELVGELAAGLPDGVLRLGHAVESVTDGGDAVVIRSTLPDGSPSTLTASLAVGCDGNQSSVREAATGDGSPPHYAGLGVWRGQCPAPKDWGAKHRHLLTGFARAGQLFLVVDLSRELGPDGARKPGWLAWQAMGPWPEARLAELKSRRYTDSAATTSGDESKRARCLEVYADYPSIALDLVRASAADTITEHGQFFREAAACSVWGRGRLTLAGDAAHLMTPFLGQGTNQALEDAVEVRRERGREGEREWEGGRARARARLPKPTPRAPSPPPQLARMLGMHGATPAALRAYEEIRIPAATRVQAGSVAIAKSMAAGDKITEVAWYTEHPDVLARAPDALVAV